MIDDFEKQEVRSSGELWSQICGPSLPEIQAETPPDNSSDFQDSFQPAGGPGNGLPNGTNTTGFPNAQWEPMEDSETYIASLENRLKRLKGQPSDVTSKDMLRSLSQAKKECWDRFLHDAHASELFQSGDMDESAVEHLKRWLVPEKVAISAEELEYLLRPSQTEEPARVEREAARGDAEEEEARES
ncbi:coiled-coil domain-containing protein 32 [Syngnathoides biaculeatus]|uniref:coiled-coil domain-containing protein 32 n=1 Tax=Syngnathoides biaculeatus TaxID=300417 RepID=UPI002ADD6392|nr:coiled-coil domain-containing protein 32 [Syngnathoides biaculeatus]XP_061700589.1 coiled-coil domain-containing protein 32 [Syngnathoides biaculeatus]XP_061700590.1 coiled-coil domain-containing protein 32 [Syngnathoides biaculeatus]